MAQQHFQHTVYIIVAYTQRIKDEDTAIAFVLPFWLNENVDCHVTMKSIVRGDTGIWSKRQNKQNKKSN